MNRWTRLLQGTWALLLCSFLLSGLAFADPLDDAAAKLGAFLQKAGLLATGLIPTAAGLAIGALAVKRAAAKAMGEDDGMARAHNQIPEVLKLTAIGTGASLLVAIAGSVLK